MLEPIRTSGPRDDLEAVSWLFEKFALLSDESADRPKIRRAWEESVLAHAADGEDRWWKCVGETSHSLGLMAKVIDCTADQMAQMVHDGARIITLLDKHWYGIGEAKRGKYLLLQPLTDNDTEWVTSRKLQAIFQPPREHRQIRCLVIEPHLNAEDPEEVGERTPFQRFRAILLPEWSDIWIILVFSMVTGMLSLASPLAVESLVNTVAFGRLLQPIIILAIMLFGFLAFSAALEAFKIFIVEIIQRRLFARVVADLAFRLPRAQAKSLEGQDARELVNRFFDVVTLQKVAALLLLDGISLVLGALIGMAVLAFYHPWLLGFDLILLAMLAFMILVLGRGAVNTSIKESKAKYYMAAWLENLVVCRYSFRLGGAAEFALDRADRLTHDYLKYRSKHFQILFRQIVFSLGIYAIASTILLGMGGWLVITGELTLGQLVAAELIVTVIVGSFAKMGKLMEGFYDVMASMDKLGNLFDLKMERQDGLLQGLGNKPARVVFNHVSHGDPHHGQVLSDLELEIASGERMMLVGPSGSGKSLLLDFLFGMQVPDAGHLTINGLEPEDMRPDVLRRQVALVRDIEVVIGSVAENVHLERPDISTMDVQQALEDVGLYEQVLQLPHGMDTHLIDKGEPLTPNQTRKLMLARAIVSRPRLLLIDGLLDSLPDEEAVELTKLLTDPEQPWTLVMVTGRRMLASLGTHIQNLSAHRPEMTDRRYHAH